jgi:hypothetical protein
MLAALTWKESQEAFFYKRFGVYQLAQDYCRQTPIKPPKVIDIDYIRLDKQGRLTLKKGFLSDGPSGPTIDSIIALIEAFIHDAFYRLMRMRLLLLSWKAAVDRFFYDGLLLAGMIQFRAYAWWRGVQEFGYGSLRPEDEPELQRAPIPFPKPPQVFISPIPGYSIPA